MAAVRRRLFDLDDSVRTGLLFAGHGLAALGFEAGRLRHRTGVLIRHRALRVFVPTRVLVVAWLLVAAHLQDTEHAAHLHRAEGAFPGHHGDGVVRNRHLHLGHVRHAPFAHDHVVGNQPDGEMQPVCDYYEKVFGWHRFWTVDDNDISTEYSALRSVVMANDNEIVKIPINEPADGLKKSQIQEFIDYYGTAGVQHLALSTRDIISTVEIMHTNGVDFLPTPPSYYEDLAKRVGPIDEDIETLARLGILVDVDENGYMLQIFTKPLQDRPTLFFEIIQRKGSNSFGKGNFRSLFESIEREQKRRGNL